MVPGKYQEMQVPEVTRIQFSKRVVVVSSFARSRLLTTDTLAPVLFLSN